jgi:hypothetical protein
MEATGCAFLKEKETPATSGIPHIVDELMNKLFVVDDNKEAPHQPPLPPPYPHPSTAPGSFLVLQPRINNLSFPMFDGKEDLASIAVSLTQHVHPRYHSACLPAPTEVCSSTPTEACSSAPRMTVSMAHSARATAVHARPCAHACTCLCTQSHGL